MTEINKKLESLSRALEHEKSKTGSSEGVYGKSGERERERERERETSGGKCE